MSHRKADSRTLGWCALLTLALVLLAGLLAHSARAASGSTKASTPPPPLSSTTCGGSLKRAKPTLDDPNLLDYQFNCDWGVNSYTLVITRGYDTSAIDDFSSTATVLDTTGNVVPTESFACSGEIPGDGVNCNTATAGTYMTAPDFATGTIDTSDPYCSNIPAGSKPGTKPEQTARVWLVVTDTNGAEDGPFLLTYDGKCPKVKAPKPGSKKTSTHKVRRLP